MERTAEGPGAALVLLRRLATTTDVLLVASGRDDAPLPCAAPRADLSQHGLLDDLIRDSRAGAVGRLYASPLSVASAEGPLGVFVAFVEDAPPGTPDGGGAWTDLREASRDLAPPWSVALAAVRERFVAQPPDEALRIR